MNRKLHKERTDSDCSEQTKNVNEIQISKSLRRKHKNVSVSFF